MSSKASANRSTPPQEEEEKPPAKKKAKTNAVTNKPIARSNENARVQIDKGKGSRVLKCLSMNVAGLRAVLDPERPRLEHWLKCVRSEEADLIFLNEHKLKTDDVDTAVERMQALIPEYTESYFTCSTTKKGYSGVAVLSKIKIENISYGFQGNLFPDEGRLLTIDFGSVAIIATYVPNSGQKLERLDARVKGEEAWDRALTRYCISLNKPVIVTGDLNVAHRPQDIHNMYPRPNFDDMCAEPFSMSADDYDSQYTGLTALKKQAGLTTVERASFSKLLSDASLTDAHIHFHPDATGVFTYYSQRAIQNRGLNRGLRLDYVLASNSLLSSSSSEGESKVPSLLDAFVLDKELHFSDHIPVGFLVELPPSSD